MLLRRSKDEDGIGGRFLKRLKQGVERAGREHVHLIDDIDGVLAYLRRDTNLVDKRTDVLHRVVRSGIEFMNIKRPLLIERLATLALVACIETVLRVQTVNRLRKNTRTRGFTNSSRPAEQVRMRQMVLTNGILQSLRQCLLSHHRLKGLWPVLTRRNNVILHILCCIYNFLFQKFLLVDS